MPEYRIESLPIIDNKEPLLLDYDSLGVFKDKVVFHADLGVSTENGKNSTLRNVLFFQLFDN